MKEVDEAAKALLSLPVWNYDPLLGEVADEEEATDALEQEGFTRTVARQAIRDHELGGRLRKDYGSADGKTKLIATELMLPWKREQETDASDELISKDECRYDGKLYTGLGFTLTELETFRVLWNAGCHDSPGLRKVEFKKLAPNLIEEEAVTKRIYRTNTKLRNFPLQITYSTDPPARAWFEKRKDLR